MVLAEIRLPKNRKKDTHNLGKTTLSKLINYCLLSGDHAKKDFFLIKHRDIFNDFVFYLEVKYGEQQFLTIRRSVESPTRISLKTHEVSEYYTDCDQWDHSDLPWLKAKEILDGILNFRVISPGTYRDALGYCLRIQDDYSDVFKLQKNSRSKDKDWKPYLAKILGFDSSLVNENYELAAKLKSKKDEAQILKGDLSGINDSSDKLDGLLLIKEDECTKIQQQLDDYNFDISDAALNKEVVEELETRIASYNEERYLLTQSIKRIQNALNEKITFNLKATEKLFQEASLYFGGQLKKDFDALMNFNSMLSEEREEYLKKELIQKESKLHEVTEEIKSLNAKRSSTLSVLKDKETFSKYKSLSSRLVEGKAKIEHLNDLKKRRESFQSLQEIISKLEAERTVIQNKINDNINSQNNRYTNIRRYFNEIIKSTIDKNAVISTKTNKEGNIEFYADTMNDQELATSESDGHTYRKLLCMAFDLAVAREYSKDNFPHFVYHDGGLESLDDRKKINFIQSIREYTKQGIQYIVTMIDSEMPNYISDPLFEEPEIILRLHDESDNGRLFRIKPW
ncbi:MAG: DUF2326 domain-containing protein [Vampirovibrionales bacterium]